MQFSADDIRFLDPVARYVLAERMKGLSMRAIGEALGVIHQDVFYHERRALLRLFHLRRARPSRGREALALAVDGILEEKRG
jgi:hypothetical protein